MPRQGVSLQRYASAIRIMAQLFLGSSNRRRRFSTLRIAVAVRRLASPCLAFAYHGNSLPLPLMADLLHAVPSRFDSVPVPFRAVLSSAVPLQYSADLCASVAFPGQAPHCPALALLFFAPPPLCCSAAVRRQTLPHYAITKPVFSLSLPLTAALFHGVSFQC